MRITKRQLRRLINEAINEHRTLPDMSSVPSQHLDKIHDLIDSGDVEMARSLIDAFGGPTDYPEAYIAYGEVGDLEKLGNKAAELHAKIPKDEYGFSKMGDMRPIYDIDDEARALAKSKVLRDHPMDPEMGLPSDEIILPDQYAAETEQQRRYASNRNRDPEVDTSGYFADDFLREHKIADIPDTISLPGGLMDEFGDEESKPMPGSYALPAAKTPVIPNLPPGQKGADFLERINDLANSLETYEMADELAKTFGYVGDSYSFDLYPDLIDRSVDSITPESNRILDRFYDLT